MENDGEEVEDQLAGRLGEVVLQGLLVAEGDSSSVKRKCECPGVDVHLLPHEDGDLGGRDPVVLDPASDAVGTVGGLLNA